MNDLVIKNVVVIPVVARPSVAAMANNLHAPLSGWDNNTWDICRTGTRTPEAGARR